MPITRARKFKQMQEVFRNRCLSRLASKTPTVASHAAGMASAGVLESVASRRPVCPDCRAFTDKPGRCPKCDRKATRGR